MNYYKIKNERRVIPAPDTVCEMTEAAARALGFYPLKMGEQPKDADKYTCAVLTYTQGDKFITVNYQMEGELTQ